MGIDHLAQHLDELFSTAAGHYIKIRKGHEEEAIHQLRVSLKKVNAVFRLAAFVAPQSFKAKLAFGPLKEIFDLAGEVRDLQIAHQVLGKYQIAYKENIQKSLNDQLVLAIGQLVEWKKRKPSGPLFVLSGASTQPLKSISQARWLKGIVGYMNRLFQKIEFLMSSQRKDKWHQVRISLKRIRFVMDWALNMKKDFISPEEYKMVRLLGELLGDWHDRVILLEKIRLQATESAKKGDKEFLKKLSSDQRSLLAASRFYLKNLLANRLV